MEFAVVVSAIVAVFVVIMAGICASGRIGRNHLVGIRLPAFFASDEAWRAGHRAAIAPTSASAAVCIVVAIVVYIQPTLAQGGPLVSLAALVIGVIGAGILGTRAAHSA